MTPAPTPPDARLSRRPLAGPFALFVAAVALGGPGCGKPPPANPDDKASAGPKGDPWKLAGLRLKKDTDFATAKQVAATLTSESSRQDGEKLPAFTDESLAAVAALVPLPPSDREELGGAAFSAHDPAYVADCLYLRDAARSLGLAGLPPERQAEHAFAWVCRQVYLHPWLRQLGGNALEPTALPPAAVLRRGFGSGLERMYVFLSLLQQLELDGCLIGPPNAAGLHPRLGGPPVKYPTTPGLAVPRGPFWAAGVRFGNDVRLFDPWRAAALPVTLNQLKAKPDDAKAWFEDKANLSGATLDDARSATAFLAVPVNALSPRMALFEAKLKGELGANFAYDLKSLEAMRAAFPDPKPAFWNPDDPFAYGRAARAYLPVEHGGGDRAPPGSSRLYESSVREQIPTSALLVRPELEADGARDRVRIAVVNSLVVSFIESPNPRERIQRGQFQEAATDLVAKQESYAAGLERLRTTDPAQQDREIREWCESANKLYAEFAAAQFRKDAEAAGLAQGQIESLWKLKPAQWIIDKLTADVGRAEAALLLALCKHEQAERLQIRLERAGGADARRMAPDALDAWKTALSAWRTYEQISAAHSNFSGRAAHAVALSARAAKFAQADGKK